MNNNTRIEVAENTIFINDEKVRFEPGSLFIENGDDLKKPLRVSLTLLPDELTIARGQKPPEEKPLIDYTKIPIHAGLYKRSEGELVGHLQNAVWEETAETTREPDQPE